METLEDLCQPSSPPRRCATVLTCFTIQQRDDTKTSDRRDLDTFICSSLTSSRKKADSQNSQKEPPPPPVDVVETVTFGIIYQHLSGDVDEGIFDSDLWMWKSVVALVLDYLPDLDLGREEEDDIDDEDHGM